MDVNYNEDKQVFKFHNNFVALVFTSLTRRKTSLNTLCSKSYVYQYLVSRVPHFYCIVTLQCHNAIKPIFVFVTIFFEKVLFHVCCW